MSVILIPTNSGPSKDEMLCSQKEAIITRLREENPEEDKRLKEIEIQLREEDGLVKTFFVAIYAIVIIISVYAVITLLLLEIDYLHKLVC